jgi:tetratricopeptide (TPR) repeat protein
MGAHLDRAQQLMEMRRHDLAVKELREELAREPDNAFAHVSLSYCLRKLERFQEARAEAEEAIRLCPSYSEAHYQLGFALETLGQWRKGETAVREALRLAPTEPKYLGHLAYICHVLDRNDEALQLANRGLQYDPKNVFCLHARALALVELGQSDLANDALKRALAEQPEDAALFAALGWLTKLTGDRRRSLEYYTESLRLNPNDKGIHAVVTAGNAENAAATPILERVGKLAHLILGRWHPSPGEQGAQHDRAP